MIDNHPLMGVSRDEGDFEEASTSNVLHTHQFGGELEFGGVTQTVHMLVALQNMNRNQHISSLFRRCHVCKGVICY